MKEFLDSFTPREAAILWWSLPILWIALRAPEVRSSLKEAMLGFLSPKVVLPFLTLTTYVTFLVYGLHRANVWNVTILKDTLFWFFGTFAVAIFKSTKAEEDPTTFGKLLRDALKVSIIIQFLCSEYTFGFLFECILVPTATLFGALGILNANKPEYNAVVKISNGILFVIGTVILWNAFRLAIADWSKLTTLQTIIKLALGPSLTILSIPALALFAAMIAYETRFLLIREFHLKEQPKLARTACWLIVRHCALSFAKLNRIRGGFYFMLAQSKTSEAVNNCIVEWSEGRGKVVWEDDDHEPVSPKNSSSKAISFT